MRAKEGDLRHGVEWVTEALLGPYCKECERRRTKNPSKICFYCLHYEDRLCHKCRGTGERLDSQGWPTGCGLCSGTGIKDK